MQRLSIFDWYIKVEDKPINSLDFARAGKTLHDRYIISDDNCWSIGSSLKDLGSKDTTITKLEDEARCAIEEMFDKRWQEAKPLY